MVNKNVCKNDVFLYGSDILNSDTVKNEKTYIQHGSVNVYDHCFNVACMSMYISYMLGIRTNKKDLIRGALLHDYFMYDWHVPGGRKGFHGFTHPKCALNNAKRDFDVNMIEQDIIKKHMFPLTVIPPANRESVIVCFADKICAVAETFNIRKMKF